MGVVLRGRNQGGEIPERHDFMLRFEDSPEERPEIKPLVRRALDGPIVEVEAVHIDDCPHQGPRKQAGPPKGPATQDRNPGGSHLIKESPESLLKSSTILLSFIDFDNGRGTEDPCSGHVSQSLDTKRKGLGRQ